jgi:hypothetical protein
MAAFCNAFLLSGLETVITPITNQSFGWGTLQNSCFFGGVAGVALLAAISSALMDKFATSSSPRGRVAMGLGLVWLALIFGVVMSHYKIKLTFILIFAALFIYGLVFLAANNTACFSILVRDRNKGFYMYGAFSTEIYTRGWFARARLRYCMRVTNAIPLGCPPPPYCYHCKLHPNTEGRAPWTVVVAF